MVMVALAQHHTRGNSLVDALVLDSQVYHRRSDPMMEHSEWAGLSEITSLIQFSNKQTCVMLDAYCISRISFDGMVDQVWSPTTRLIPSKRKKIDMLVGSVICRGLFPTISYLVKLFIRFMLSVALRFAILIPDTYNL